MRPPERLSIVETRLASTAGLCSGAITTDVPSFTFWETAATYASVSSGSGTARPPAAAPEPEGICPLSEYGYFGS